jgi:hypothetical protein
MGKKRKPAADKAGGIHNPPDRAVAAEQRSYPPRNGADVTQVTHPKTAAKHAK